MSRLSSALLCLCLAPALCFAQPRKIEKPETKEEFLARSKSQRTAAWILLGAGAIGIAAISPGNSSFSTTGAVAVLSGAAIIGSVPLFIAAGKNKRRASALAVSLQLEKLRTPSVSAYNNSHSIALSIKLRR
jgi:hypothetical protein